MTQQTSRYLSKDEYRQRIYALEPLERIAIYCACKVYEGKYPKVEVMVSQLWLELSGYAKSEYDEHFKSARKKLGVPDQHQSKNPKYFLESGIVNVVNELFPDAKSLNTVSYLVSSPSTSPSDQTPRADYSNKAATEPPMPPQDQEKPPIPPPSPPSLEEHRNRTRVLTVTASLLVAVLCLIGVITASGAGVRLYNQIFNPQPRMVAATDRPPSSPVVVSTSTVQGELMRTDTPAVTATASLTATITPTASITPSPTITATHTASATATVTPTPIPPNTVLFVADFEQDIPEGTLITGEYSLVNGMLNPSSDIEIYLPGDWTDYRVTLDYLDPDEFWKDLFLGVRAKDKTRMIAVKGEYAYSFFTKDGAEIPNTRMGQVPAHVEFQAQGNTFTFLGKSVTISGYERGGVYLKLPAGVQIDFLEVKTLP